MSLLFGSKLLNSDRLDHLQYLDTAQFAAPTHGMPSPNIGYAQASPAPDKLIFGALAGVMLFYLFGKAIGLGRKQAT